VNYLSQTMSLYNAWFSEKSKLSKKMFKAYVEKGDIRSAHKNSYMESPISFVFRNIYEEGVEATEYYPIGITRHSKWNDAVFIGVIKAWIYNIYD